MFELFEATRRSLLGAFAATPVARIAMASDDTSPPTAKPIVAATYPASDAQGEESAIRALMGAMRGKLMNLPVSPEDFGAKGDGVTDDSSAIQQALDSGRPVVLNGKKYNIGKFGLLVRKNQLFFSGNNAEIHYHGNGYAISISEEASASGWLTNCVLMDFSIYCHGQGTGICWRFSYSIATNVSVALYNGNSIGWLVDTDVKNGTGPYYNIFVNCHVQGKSFMPGYDGTYGWKFTSYIEAPTRGPNTNTWIGGRASGCNVNYLILGAGNAFIRPTSETVPKGGWHFRFENEHSPNPAGNTGNGLYHPYIEGQEGANAFYIDANAFATFVHYTYTTSIGGGTFIEDHGGATSLQLHDGIYMPNVGSSDKRVFDWYQEGTFTPAIQGSSSISGIRYREQSGNFTRIGNMVHCDISLSLRSIGTGITGDAIISGLPFQSAATGVSSGAISRANIKLAPGYTQIGAAMTPSAKIIRLTKMKSGQSTTAISGAEIREDFELALSLSYRV